MRETQSSRNNTKIAVFRKIIDNQFLSKWTEYLWNQRFERIGTNIHCRLRLEQLGCMTMRTAMKRKEKERNFLRERTNVVIYSLAGGGWGTGFCAELKRAMALGRVEEHSDKMEINHSLSEPPLCPLPLLPGEKSVRTSFATVKGSSPLYGCGIASTA